MGRYLLEVITAKQFDISRDKECRGNIGYTVIVHSTVYEYTFNIYLEQSVACMLIARLLFPFWKAKIKTLNLF
jgi:hypothetical protein